MIVSFVRSRVESLSKELAKIYTAHHIFNILLTASFWITKLVVPVCHLVYGDRNSNIQCGYTDRREHEILVFVGVVIFWKNRKSTNWAHYMSNVFVFGRLANLALFFRADPLIGIVYTVLYIVGIVLFPEPVFSGPENITYYQGATLRDELERNKRNVYLIEFYTSWSPECQRIAPVFAELSQQYSLSNLRFGKLDMGRFPKDGEHFRINTHATSRQLPTVSLFKNSQEVMRRPYVTKGRATPFVFSKENMIQAFDLNNLYKECKENMSKADKKELDENDKKDN